MKRGEPSLSPALITYTRGATTRRQESLSKEDVVLTARK